MPSRHPPTHEHRPIPEAGRGWTNFTTCTVRSFFRDLSRFMLQQRRLQNVALESVDKAIRLYLAEL